MLKKTNTHIAKNQARNEKTEMVVVFLFNV